MRMDLEQVGIGNKNCETCAFHDDFTWVCFNPDSDNRADFTDKEYCCIKWENKNDEK